MLQRMVKPVHCEAFLATLGTQLESVTEFQLFQRWNNIGLPYSGKLGLEHLVDMELEFDSLRHHLSYLSEEEYHRHLMEKLPSHWVGCR